MPKKPCVRTLTDSQHVKGSERVVKSARQSLFDIFLSLWKKISSKNLVLVLSEILRLFANILIPDEKYFVPVKASVEGNQFKSNYLQIKTFFLHFLLHFRNLHKMWNTLKKKMILICHFLLKFYTWKMWSYLNA